MKVGHVIYLKGTSATEEDVLEVIEELGCTVTSVDSIHQAERLIDRKSVDLVILDVAQNDENDIIDFSTSLKNEDVPIIFLAFDSNRAIYQEAKQANLIAFLVSPIDMLTLTSIVETALRQKKKNSPLDLWADNQYLEETLFIKVNQLLQKVNISDITHVQSEGNYCYIFTPEKKFAIKLSMIRLNHMMASRGILQVHKSYLVQLNKIDNIDISANEVIIGHLKIPLGRKYKQELLTHLNLL